jgi:Arc/MetJ-type ribon-helix-helix transcriptional regulator
MVRTQIQLTEEQARLVKQIAAERHTSMAEVIRDGLDRLLRSSANALPQEDRIRRAIEVAGRYRSGATDGSTEHDKHLAEAFSG